MSEEGVECVIKHVRVDERLIHGQVAMVWVNFLSCDRIIVADDEAVKNEMVIAALKIACPSGVKLSILSLNKAIVNIKEGKYDGDNVFLICKSIQGCKALIDGGVELKHFNVGNLAYKEGQTKIKNSVSLSRKDLEDIRELLGRGIEITAQMLPNEPADSIATFI